MAPPQADKAKAAGGDKGSPAGAAKGSPAKGAAESAAAEAEAAKHAVVYSKSQSEIKDDLPALVACLRTNKGQLTRQEAALLLAHHALQPPAHADLVAAGAVNACLGVLDATAAPIGTGASASGGGSGGGGSGGGGGGGGGSGRGAETTAAATILLHLAQSKEPAVCEAVAKGKAAAAVLHRWLPYCGDEAGRAAARLLAALAAEPLSRAVLLKSIEGGPPWALYASVLGTTPCHDAVRCVAALVGSLVQQREDLSEQAGAAGLPAALLAAARRHKSEAAVGAAARALRALVDGAGAGRNRGRLAEVPGAIQVLTDILGPPPPPVVAWEQHTYAHILQPQPAKPAPPQQPQQPPPHTPPAHGPAPLQLHLQLLGGAQAQPSAGGAPARPSSIGSVARRVALPAEPGGAAGDAAEGAGGGGDPRASQPGDVTRRRLGDRAGSPTPSLLQRSKSLKGSLTGSIRTPDGPQPGDAEQQGPGLPLKEKNKRASCLGAAAAVAAGLQQQQPAPPPPPPQPPGPLLCRSSVALKWEAPVSAATRAAAAGCLWALAQAPGACAAMSSRLAAPRLAALVAGAARGGAGAPAAAGGAAPKKPKKKGLALDPDQEALLTAAVGCLRLMAVESNADLYRVAATPKALAAVTSLADDADSALLRRSTQALAAQAALLAEASAAVEAAGVPAALRLAPGGVQMRLTPAEVQQLAVEHPALLQLPPQSPFAGAAGPGV